MLKRLEIASHCSDLVNTHRDKEKRESASFRAILHKYNTLDT